MHLHGRAHRLFLVLILFALVGCDHGTKFAAKSALENEAPRQLLRGVLDLRYVENTDIAFNLLRWVPEHARAGLLVALGLVAVVTLSVVLFRSKTQAPTQVALLLVTAGAIGNYGDRLLRGYVVDFMHLTHWPVFNVADIYVTAGVLLLALLSFRHGRAGPAPPAT